jgi:acyl-CoA thioesterase FadM
MAITMTAETVSVPTEAALRALCAREHAQTADLRVRYRRPVRTTERLEIHAWLQRSFGPLHELEAEIHQHGAVCAKAWGKFIATAASDASVSAESDYVAAPRGFGVAEQKRTHSREGKFRE